MSHKTSAPELVYVGRYGANKTPSSVSAATESLSTGTGLSHTPSLALTSAERLELAYSLLKTVPAQELTKKHLRRPDGTPEESNTTERTPFDHYNKILITMEDVVKWWCLPETWMTMRLVKDVSRLFKTQPFKSPWFTGDVIKVFFGPLYEVFCSVGFGFYIYQEYVIGDKLVLLDCLPKGFKLSHQALVLFEDHATLSAEEANMICTANRATTNHKTRIIMLADNSFQTPAVETAAVNDIGKGANGGNPKAKGAARAQALVMDSMRLSGRRHQAYACASSSEWIFGVTEAEENDVGEGGFLHHQLEKVDIPVLDHDAGNLEQHVKDMEGLFVLWTAWTVTPAQQIARYTRRLRDAATAADRNPPIFNNSRCGEMRN